MPSESPQLVRAMGRWTLSALVFNCIVGSAVYGLPSVVATYAGQASVVLVPLVALLTLIIIACHAEAASHFTQSGGAYLYAHAAFGRLVGIEVGWFLLLGRLSASAASANLFVTYLAALWPGASQPVMRLAVLTLLIGFMAVVNYIGVSSGAQLSNAFVAAKLGILGFVCVIGIIYASRAPHASVVASPHHWASAVLVLLFAYGGFEAALNPMGEARNPKRDAAFALFAALAAVALIYTIIQWAVMRVVPDPLHSTRPIGDLFGIAFGRRGSALVSVAVLISIYGYISAQMLTAPRGTFALAEKGDFPRPFAAVHPRFRTPHVSITVFALLLWALSVFGNFSWNVTLSAVARLFYYGVVCASVLRLRKLKPGGFRLPLGPVLPVAGVAICAALFSAVDFSQSAIAAAVALAALLNWVAVRNRAPVR